MKFNTVAHTTFQENINNYLQGSPDDTFGWFAGYRARFFANKGLVGDISDVYKATAGIPDSLKKACSTEAVSYTHLDVYKRQLADLDYQVNDIARTLATKKPGRIGAFVFDVDDWAPQRVLAGAAEAARAEGYILDIVRLDPSGGASIDAALSMMNRTMLAGVVVISSSDKLLSRLDLDRLKVCLLYTSRCV